MSRRKFEPIPVVIDLNVAVSSALGGPAAAPAKVIRLMIEGRIVNFASKLMLERLRAKLGSRRVQRYLANKSSGPAGELLWYKPYAIVTAFEIKSVVISPESLVDASEDEEDNEVLSVACDAGVEYLITQDQDDLLSLRNPETKEVIIEDEDGNEVCRIKILTPREFLEELKKRGWVI
ncbi:putative toxin-antitoxin system toxin component, PIN family [Thermococcus sp. 21S7]|uniref:putative toxin-antitoxin system toxin component, PIN family n=1 Tax=Thermococcus sp. 21S7 TaxID=1638221 RepID=UPI0014391D8D|nr:putative toxin-antitoxin system toxin component, PIN family [Thermococcus sp. 21S7]NJE60964.1 putative toxin-antitoxin system toxin component, PIN family [Thermococcus sp. 21S7]